MKLFISFSINLFIILFIFSIKLSALGIDSVKLTQSQQRMLYLDSTFNTRKEFNPSGINAIRDITTIAVTENDLASMGYEVEVLVAAQFENILDSPLLKTTDQKIFIYFLNDVPKKLKRYIVNKEVFAFKFLSHGTFYVWDPKIKTNGDMFLKFPGLNFNSKPRIQAEKSVQRTELIENILQQRFPENFGYYPEPIAFLLKNKATGRILHSYILRMPKPHFVIESENSAIYPLHALLGWTKEKFMDGPPPNLFEIASCAGLTINEWIDTEYMSKLGRFISEVGLKYGIWIEAHTQNLLVEINEDTGRILRFFFRDLGDTIIDTFILGQNYMIPNGILNKDSIKDIFQVDKKHSILNSKRTYELLAPYLHDYLSYSLVGKEQQFLLSFIDEAEKILGASLQNSRIIRKTIESGEDLPVDDFSNPMSRLPRMARIMQLIYNDSITGKLETHLKKTNININQDDLTWRFIKKLERNEVRFSLILSKQVIEKFLRKYKLGNKKANEIEFYYPLAPNMGKKISLEFRNDGERVYVFNRNSGHILAATVNSVSVNPCSLIFEKNIQK